MEFILRCVHCGRCYGLTEEAQNEFLKCDDALGRFSKNIKCCDKSFYGVDMPLRTIESNEMKKLLEG